MYCTSLANQPCLLPIEGAQWGDSHWRTLIWTRHQAILVYQHNYYVFYEPFFPCNSLYFVVFFGGSFDGLLFVLRSLDAARGCERAFTWQFARRHAATPHRPPLCAKPHAPPSPSPRPRTPLHDAATSRVCAAQPAPPYLFYSNITRPVPYL